MFLSNISATAVAVCTNLEELGQYKSTLMGII